MARTTYDELIDVLYKGIIVSATTAHETQYDRGVFDAYAEAYSEVCAARVCNGELSLAYAYIEAWADAIFHQFEGRRNISEHLRAMNNTARVILTYFE